VCVLGGGQAHGSSGCGSGGPGTRRRCRACAGQGQPAAAVGGGCQSAAVSQGSAGACLVRVRVTQAPPGSRVPDSSEGPAAGPGVSYRSGDVRGSGCTTAALPRPAHLTRSCGCFSRIVTPAAAPGPLPPPPAPSCRSTPLPRRPSLLLLRSAAPPPRGSPLTWTSTEAAAAAAARRGVGAAFQPDPCGRPPEPPGAHQDAAGPVRLCRRTQAGGEDRQQRRPDDNMLCCCCCCCQLLRSCMTA